MTINEILEKRKEICGDERLVTYDIDDIRDEEVIYYNVRCKYKGGVDDEKSTRILGNLIFFTIGLCHDLGYDVEECIEMAIENQRKIRTE
ncbi:hypothetical protein ACFLZ0_02260 [Patescibacteria group bacterium]